MWKPILEGALRDEAIAAVEAVAAALSESFSNAKKSPLYRSTRTDLLNVVYLAFYGVGSYYSWQTKSFGITHLLVRLVLVLPVLRGGLAACDEVPRKLVKWSNFAVLAAFLLGILAFRSEG